MYKRQHLLAACGTPSGPHTAWLERWAAPCRCRASTSTRTPWGAGFGRDSMTTRNATGALDALRAFAHRAGESIVVAHVLDGDRPAVAVATELGVSLARLYKRATAARSRLLDAALELRSRR